MSQMIHALRKGARSMIIALPYVSRETQGLDKQSELNLVELS